MIKSLLRDITGYLWWAFLSIVMVGLALIFLGQPVFAQDVVDPVSPVATGLLDSIVNWIATAAGISAGTLAVILLVLRQVSEIIVKTIPDDETSTWKIWVRRLATVLAGYRRNVVTKKT